MAYRTTRRRSSYRARPRTGRRYTSRRRTSRRSGTRQSRIVIQVIGAPGAGVPVSAVTLGKKSARPLRRRY